jgi:hypothetical protein
VVLELNSLVGFWDSHSIMNDHRAMLTSRNIINDVTGSCDVFVFVKNALESSLRDLVYNLFANEQI